jgi:hypothetical protein
MLYVIAAVFSSASSEQNFHSSRYYAGTAFIHMPFFTFARP